LSELPSYVGLRGNNKIIDEELLVKTDIYPALLRKRSGTKIRSDN